MAGMLAGVECARRRRLHQSRDCPSISGHNSTRRSSFCLYTTSHDSLNYTSSMKQQRSSNPYPDDEKLGGAAREAKERLDERLRAQWKSDPPKRKNCQESLKGVNGGGGVGELQREVYGMKKSGGTNWLTWGKLIRWKSSEQEECAICLEGFSAGETLAHPPCAHRFHSKCLDPWLNTNAHCPCCRTTIWTGRDPLIN